MEIPLWNRFPHITKYYYQIFNQSELDWDFIGIRGCLLRNGHAKGHIPQRTQNSVFQCRICELNSLPLGFFLPGKLSSPSVPVNVGTCLLPLYLLTCLLMIFFEDYQNFLFKKHIC